MLIAISGKMNSGKDEVANMLSYLLYCKRENFDSSYEMYEKYMKNMTKGVITSLCKNRIHKFAERLKWALASCIGESRFQFEDRNYKSQKIEWLNNISVRELMQKFASAIRHEVDEDFWIKTTLHNYKDSYTWFISDLRYLNEARAVKSLNGILIRINRPTTHIDNHPSETELDNYPYWDFVIENNKGLEELYELCKNIINSI